MPDAPPTPKYPDVKVNLAGLDGHDGAILGTCCSKAMRAGVTADEIAAFRREAKAQPGDSGHLRRTCEAWFTIE